MASNTVVVPTNGVEGNITSCGIDTAEIAVQRDGVWALQQVTTYRSYNVCTQEIVQEYTVPTFTAWGVFMPIVVVSILLSILFAWASHESY